MFINAVIDYWQYDPSVQLFILDHNLAKVTYFKFGKKKE